MSWSANTLTLNATNGIYVNSIMTVSGTGSLAASYSTLPVTDVYSPPYGLYMAKGSTNGIEDGTYAGPIDFSGTGTLTLNNHPYTVYQTLSALTNAINTDTRTRLSAITPSVQTELGHGHRSTYSTTAAPITTLNGNLEGLGHTISGLTINNSSASTPTGFIGATGTGALISI